MITREFYKEVVLNFVKENSKILILNAKDTFLFSLIKNKSLVTVQTCDRQFYEKNINNEINFLFEEDFSKLNLDEQFNLILLENSNYSIETINENLKSNGHFITLQEDITDLPLFNLENQFEQLEESGYKIIKCNQSYDENIGSNFYILAKKLQK